MTAIAWVLTLLIIFYLLRKWWREAVVENEKERQKIIAARLEMVCKKCGYMSMSLGSLSYCLRCDPYGPKEWYQNPFYGSDKEHVE